MGELLAMATAEGFKTLTTHSSSLNISKTVRNVPLLNVNDEMSKKIDFQSNRPLQMVSVEPGVYFCCYERKSIGPGTWNVPKVNSL